MPPKLRAHDHLWCILAKGGKKKPPQACIPYYWSKTTQQLIQFLQQTDCREWKRKGGKL